MLNILPAATALPFYFSLTKQVDFFRLLRQPVLSWFLYQPSGKRQPARLKTADQNPFMATHRQQSDNGIGASVTSIPLRFGIRYATAAAPFHYVPEITQA
jgi:hypothetical protein